jgi:AcrR family transcriptional regulator
MARPRSFDADAVIDAAVDDFWSSTYSATSTEDLCHSTGLSRSSLYNSFGSKRDVYLSALHRYAGIKQEQRAALMQSDVDSRTLLAQVISASLEAQWSDPDRRACFGINASLDVGVTDPEIAELLEANARSFDDFLTQVIARGQEDGSFRGDRPAADLARALHAFVDGLQVRTRIRPSRDEQQRDVDTALSLL